MNHHTSDTDLAAFLLASAPCILAGYQKIEGKYMWEISPHSSVSLSPYILDFQNSSSGKNVNCMAFLRRKKWLLEIIKGA